MENRKLIKNYLAKHDKTLTWLSNFTGIDKGLLSNYFRWNEKLSYKALKKIAGITRLKLKYYCWNCKSTTILNNKRG